MTSSHQLELVRARPAPARPPLGATPAAARRPPALKLKSRRVTDREQASLSCAHALATSASTRRSLLVHIDRDDASLVLALGNQPLVTWRINVLPKQLMPLEDLRERAQRALQDARLPRLCASVHQIVVTPAGTALARSILLDALVAQLGDVAIRRADSVAHA